MMSKPMKRNSFVVKKTGRMPYGARWVEGTVNDIPTAITENGKGTYAVSKQDVDGGHVQIVKDTSVRQLTSGDDD